MNWKRKYFPSVHTAVGQEEAKEKQLALISGQLVAFFFYIRVHIIFGERKSWGCCQRLIGSLLSARYQS